jgi:hypothetical protein
MLRLYVENLDYAAGIVTNRECGLPPFSPSFNLKGLPNSYG